MQDPDALATRYLDAFNETDAERRRALLRELFADDGTYTDPNVDLRGPAQVDAFVAQTQERFPGYEFKLGGPVDAHHDQARFQWHAGPPEDPARYVGFDVIVAPNGRLERVYGFMDVVPAQ